jgi:hypothetical protein
MDAIKQLKKIKASAPIGILTCDHRDAWTKAREHLVVLDPKNRESLQVIEDALFCVTLDSTAEATKADRKNNFAEWAKFGMHGHGGRNRWCDKSLNLIFERDGKFVCHGEVIFSLYRGVVNVGRQLLGLRIESVLIVLPFFLLNQIALALRCIDSSIDYGLHYSQAHRLERP